MRSQRGNGSESRSSICSLMTLPLRDDALRQAHDAGFWLAVQDEVAVAFEEVRHLRGGDADEADLHAAGAHPVRPRRFGLVVDQRRQHQRDVAVVLFATGPDHFMAGARQDRSDIGQVDAGNVVELFLEIRHHFRDACERIEPRSVSANDRIFARESAIGFKVCENDPHQSPQKNRYTPRRLRRTALRRRSADHEAIEGSRSGCGGVHRRARRAGPATRATEFDGCRRRPDRPGRRSG